MVRGFMLRRNLVGVHICFSAINAADHCRLSAGFVDANAYLLACLVPLGGRESVVANGRLPVWRVCLRT